MIRVQSAANASMRRKHIRHAVKMSLPFYLMVLLPIAYYIVFHYIPMFGIVIAFKDYNIYQGIWGSPWMGLQYFNEFLSDPYFYKVLRNTMVIGLYHILFNFPAPIILALLLNEIKSNRFKRVVQTVSYIPHFLSTVVVCGIVLNLLSSDGLINQFLMALGLERIQFMILPQWFRTVFVTSGIWTGIGWASIIYLAALAGINPTLYEAASIDGASRMRMALNITLPGILPTVMVMLIFQVGSILSVSFEKVLLLYNGAIYETADVLQTYIYRRGLIGNDFSYATAVGLFSSVISVLFLASSNFLSRKLTDNGLW